MIKLIESGRDGDGLPGDCRDVRARPKVLRLSLLDDTDDNLRINRPNLLRLLRVAACAYRQRFCGRQDEVALVTIIRRFEVLHALLRDHGKPARRELAFDLQLMPAALLNINLRLRPRLDQRIDACVLVHKE